MSNPSIVQVLAEHQLMHHIFNGMEQRTYAACSCGTTPLSGDFPIHQSEALTAAGFGLAFDAKSEARDAAAAGLRSVFDIWGAGGRATVRMSEIHEADTKILAGEWDNHIEWNLADIAKERSRSKIARGAAL